MLRETPVVILAGGLGTRLRPALAGLPKGLAPIGDRPFLQIQMELLRDQGARRFVLCVGYLADQIREAFGDGRQWGVDIAYSLEGRQLLGTAGALKLAQRFFEPWALVLNGDTYLAMDYNRLLAQHRLERCEATLTLARTNDAERFGTVLLDTAGRHVIGFREKVASTQEGTGWVNAGAYVIEHDFLGGVPPGVQVSLERDVFPQALQSGKRLGAMTCMESFFDIGTPGDWGRFAEYYGGLRRAA